MVVEAAPKAPVARPLEGVGPRPWIVRPLPAQDDWELQQARCYLPKAKGVGLSKDVRRFSRWTGVYPQGPPFQRAKVGDRERVSQCTAHSVSSFTSCGSGTLPRPAKASSRTLPPSCRSQPSRADQGSQRRGGKLWPTAFVGAVSPRRAYHLYLSSSGPLASLRSGAPHMPSEHVSSHTLRLQR